MVKILEGLRIVEGSAFVAAPFSGMTLAQMGADVIRFDRLIGGLDYKRWPVTESGRSLFWEGVMTLILSATSTIPLQPGVTSLLGWKNPNLWQTALAFLMFLALQASLPFLVILATSGRRVRSVAPFVLAGLLIFSFSNLFAGDAFFLGMDVALTHGVMNSWDWDGVIVYNGWCILAALPIGYICWVGLRW